MQHLKIYSVTDKYIDWLREKFPEVYSNKVNNRTHTRKYVGVVLKINEFNYFVPLSSPKQTDYQFAGGDYVIKKSIVPIIRIVVKNKNGDRELKGTLRISHMIPVPDSELIPYDLELEADLKYKDLVQNEMLFIRRNKERILSNATLLYKQKLANDQTAGYVKAALDYVELEKRCKEYSSLRP